MPDTESQKWAKQSEDFKADSLYTDPVVKVVVGPLAQPFYIHKSCLAEASPFFKASLSAWATDEQEQTEVTFPNVPCRAFGVLVEWIYKHQVSEVKDHTQAMSAVQAWTLGNTYGIPAFQNALLDELGRFWTYNCVQPQFLSWVAKNSNNTALQRFVFDQLAFDLVHSSNRYREKQNPDGEGEVDSVTGDRYVQPLRDLLADPDICVKLFWATNTLERGGADPAYLVGYHYHVREEAETCSKEEPGKKTGG